MTSPRSPLGSGARLLGLKAAAEYLGVSYWTLRDLVHSGALPRVRLTVGDHRDLRRVLVDRADLDRLVEASKER